MPRSSSAKSVPPTDPLARFQVQKYEEPEEWEATEDRLWPTPCPICETPFERVRRLRDPPPAPTADALQATTHSSG